ncbi:MAG: glutathione S-transferase family protein [Gammaproteobacteria bacterium]|nr:glutathione S-transferase family protein [Gammaproteobacteria bacterium]
MKLYCAWYCPFAQRAWMALEQKGLDYKYIEVDPYEQADWWLKLSRGSALVPVLVQENEGGGETTIVESNRVLEYLEDLYPEQNPIFADHPDARAEQKYWMDHVNNKIAPHLYHSLRDPKPDSEEKLLDGLTQLVEAMNDREPYFNGDSVSAVDIALMPFVYRIVKLLGYYRDFTLPNEGKQWQRLQAWYEAMQALPAFKATSTDHDNYLQRLITHYR